MGDISPHFNLSEFTKTSRGKKYVDMNLEFLKEPNNTENIKKLCRILEPIREVLTTKFKIKAMNISSGVRCPELNKIIGGSNTSQHVWAEACDFIVDGTLATTTTVFEMLMNKQIQGIDYSDISQIIAERRIIGKGMYSPWIHIAIITDRFIDVRKAAKRNTSQFPEYMVSLDGNKFLPATTENINKFRMNLS